MLYMYALLYVHTYVCIHTYIMLYVYLKRIWQVRSIAHMHMFDCLTVVCTPMTCENDMC